MEKLTPKQQLFVREYLKDLNGTRAAERAGYSAKTAQEQSSRLLSNVMVQAEIQKHMDRRAEKLEITSERILRELLTIATVDISKAFNEHGHLLPIADMPEEIRRAIAGVEIMDEFLGSGRDRTKIGETTKIKFWDKPKTLELLGKHLKLFTERVEHSGAITLEQLVAGSTKPEGTEE